MILRGGMRTPYACRYCLPVLLMVFPISSNDSY